MSKGQAPSKNSKTDSTITRDASVALRVSPKVRTTEQQEHYERVSKRNAAIAAGPGSGLPCPPIYGEAS